MPKVSKSRSLSHSPPGTNSNPFHRLLSRVKSRQLANSPIQKPVRHGRPDPDPVVDTPPEKPRARVALQNEDLTEDVVVITALSTLPFCCHEDLLTMSRPGLVAVAESLNEKLPIAMRISISRTRTDTAIRNEVEFIVGLRNNRTHVHSVTTTRHRTPPPTTPTSVSRKRHRVIYGTPATPMLERLAEVEEEVEEPVRRKRLVMKTPEPDASSPIASRHNTSSQSPTTKPRVDHAVVKIKLPKSRKPLEMTRHVSQPLETRRQPMPNTGRRAASCSSPLVSAGASRKALLEDE
ncbi:Glutamine amidotransferase type-2 domain-containing protein [Mycena indigotica]|uniref:Glutamine amidotransferase type-2 domain-containing protein n=1 Tax=Mycena indigotica TaxID=2126181 RepID=A0A8H6SAI0_9AGAR|nr:Glutamine amidotransferase type-2 domain-containing protein [Mycena indigotica]KAF7295185.1 Glutamine amidotransferase type-2 domain-containing protein [Mycena indigotica]